MRIDMPCPECARQYNRPIYVSLDMDESALYSFECPFAHKTVILAQEQRFEMLSQVGAHAIVDGYYREAVSAFNASLEQFYFFCTHALFLHFGKGSEYFEKIWKSLALSERQLGAFLATWSLAFDEKPLLLPDGSENVMGRKFRNKVIHEGQIPTREEAIEFGQCIVDIVHPQMVRLRGLNEDAVDRVYFHRIRQIRSQAPDDERVWTMGQTTVLSVYADEQRTLLEHLKDIQNRRYR